MTNNLALIQAVSTIVAAVISAFALIKVNRIDNQDRIRRSLWSFEQYLLSVGKCIGNPSEKNFEEYYAKYALFSLYADNEIKETIKTLNEYMKNREIDLVNLELDILTDKYAGIYNMKKYYPKKKKWQ